MADGTPISYSYSPSGSTTELIDHANRDTRRPSSRMSPPGGSSVSWHPKLTLYRLLVIFTTGGLAAAKTATSLLNLNFASITLELILGVVVYLFFHILGEYEGTSSRYSACLFHIDCMQYLWTFLESLTSFKRPYYISDEIDIRHQTMGIDPLVTGYRIIVTVLVASFGMTKSGLLYGQEPMEATIVECVFGVGIATGIYCLGLYEASSIKVYPTLFHVDYFPYITEVVMVLLQLSISAFLVAIPYGFYHLMGMIIPFDVPPRSGMGTIEGIVIAVVMGTFYLHYLVSFFMIVLVIMTAIGVMTYFVFKGVMFVARKYFTVDVELVDAPVY